MSEETTLTVTSDERMMAALAHFFGTIGALIVWVAQKDKSRFVRFQAIQALAFDFSVMILMLVLFAFLFGAMFIGMFGSIFATLNTSASPESVGPFLFVPLMFLSLMTICIFPFSLGILVARIVAMLSVLNGNDFRYPLLGSQVEKFLADEKRS